MLKRLAQFELKGLSRLTGLVGVADMLVQEHGAECRANPDARARSRFAKAPACRKAKQQASLAERLRHATDSSERSQIATQLHAKESRDKHSLTEGAQSRESTRGSDPAPRVGARRLSQDREGAQRRDR